MYIEPPEIFVIAFDEDCRPRNLALLGEPECELARAIMIARRLVDPARIRPNTEVTDMQDVVKPDIKDLLECEHVLVKAVEGSMNIASSTDDHKRNTLIF
jgi:hypothetical protein